MENRENVGKETKKEVLIIIPAYNEEKMIQKAADTLDRILGDAEIPYELVFVNDGSKDGTWAAIEAAAKKNPHVTAVCP